MCKHFRGKQPFFEKSFLAAAIRAKAHCAQILESVINTSFWGKPATSAQYLWLLWLTVECGALGNVCATLVLKRCVCIVYMSFYSATKVTFLPFVHKVWTLTYSPYSIVIQMHSVSIHNYSGQECKVDFTCLNRNNFLLCREGDIYDDVEYPGGESCFILCSIIN